jgi:hypothetical protein
MGRAMSLEDSELEEDIEDFDEDGWEEDIDEEDGF